MAGHLNPNLLLLIPLAPLFGSIVVGLFGTRFFGNYLGKVGSYGLTIFAVLVSFIFSIQSLIDVLDGKVFNETFYTWLVAGEIKFEIGFLVDKLSSIMMCVVTFVSLMVHLYTIGYMKKDEGFNRFFSYISLFTFAMLILVMSNNFLQLFFGWEAVGLISYLLIGFWYKKSTAIKANFKAFIVNRVGDFGFILGIGLILAYSGSMNYYEVFEKSSLLFPGNLPGTNISLVTIICICLFIGAMGKSAQFPLHVWLPDSMEGPTPISALIHAATMVTAGIFMVARMSPIFELSETALSLIMIIGSITALFMGFMGIIQNDIKRIVAYSTLSQLGYMTVALGASAYSLALFHLVTHAFFKALLFLSAGSVIMSLHHNQDIRSMGGLKKFMPITWITCLLGSLALIGTPFFSGFYSKESIIEAVHYSDIFGSNFAYFSLLLGIFLTAFYSFRMYFVVFHGKLRLGNNSSTEKKIDNHEKNDPFIPKEQSWIILIPLILLSIPSVLIGFFTAKLFIKKEFFEDIIFVSENHRGPSLVSESFVGSLEMAFHSFQTLPFYLSLFGVISAMYCFLLNPKISDWFLKKFSLIHVLLEKKYYIDIFNEFIFVDGIKKLAGFLNVFFEKILIDGFFVNGSAKIVNKLSTVIRFSKKLLLAALILKSIGDD